MLLSLMQTRLSEILVYEEIQHQNNRLDPHGPLSQCTWSAWGSQKQGCSKSVVEASNRSTFLSCWWAWGWECVLCRVPCWFSVLNVTAFVPPYLHGFHESCLCSTYRGWRHRWEKRWASLIISASRKWKKRKENTDIIYTFSISWYVHSPPSYYDCFFNLSWHRYPNQQVLWIRETRSVTRGWPSGRWRTRESWNSRPSTCGARRVVLTCNFCFISNLEA